MNLNDGLIGLQKEPPYKPPFKIGDDVYAITCGMREPAKVSDMPYKTVRTCKLPSGRWLCKVFLTKARTHVVYEIANIVHREREMDKLSSWEITENVLGCDIRCKPSN